MKAEAYLSRGVSPTKDDVRQAVKNQDKGLYPGAFCKIVKDLAEDPAWCAAVHADGAGTKSSAAYLMYRETGDPGWFGGIAQDSLVMNTDDLLCIGAVDQFFVSNTIGRNAHRVDAACLQAIIAGYERITSMLAAHGISLSLTGGETADVGDLVRTVICDSTAVVRLPRAQVIDASRICPGQVIIGLASFGQTSYEDRENSGIGSNGLTAARHLLLHKDYLARYPESCSDTLPPGKAYCGRFHLQDALPGSSLTVGEAILSPTRTYLPVVKRILAAYPARISGMIHCTGGGQAKCLSFGRGIRYVKDNLFPAPPVFRAIGEVGEMAGAELYQVFNMGHRLEIICDEADTEPIIGMCAEYNLPARRVGYTETASDRSVNELVLCTEGHTYTYRPS